MSRQCTECRTPLGRENPPAAPVVLREGQPGATVPRLAITLLGSLCAACARELVAPRRATR
ncbi:MAG: hypothetical protein IPI75_08210 [Gammaproteobacteria bacterium]|nr:hypothetical protein [Gammaproteobacteria bacterium]